LSVYPAHFCHPRKIKKKFSKSENKEIPDTKNIKNNKTKKKKKKGRHKDETSTNHHLQKTKKGLVLEILSRSLFK
jgi:hypothetical protein